MFVQGGVYRYSYLWAREHDAGEESGRKERPVCLIFKSAKGQLFVVPLTTRRPMPGRTHIEVPPHELKRAGLSGRSWIVLNEFNSSYERKSYDFASVEPLGRFSDAFLSQLVVVVLDLIAKRRMRGIARN